MKFKDFKFNDENHFVAMQYYGLILNRTFLVLLTKDLIVGIKANGFISVEGKGNGLAEELTKKLTVKGDLQNPYSYLKSKYIDGVRDCEISKESILKQNKSNFVIPYSEVANAYHDPKKKWGMGDYPHDGRVYIETKNGKKKEFIILGNQSGRKISGLLMVK